MELANAPKRNQIESDNVGMFDGTNSHAMFFRSGNIADVRDFLPRLLEAR